VRDIFLNMVKNFIQKSKVLSEEDIRNILYRLTNQILENESEVENLILIGIQTRGVYLANRIRDIIKEIKNIEVPLGVLDITFYRDDLTKVGTNPIVRTTDIDFDINEKIIILVDDVLFTGRTVRAALDEIMDFGRPKKIKLLVLIDRGHRELPIKADFVGKNIPTSTDEVVVVYLKEIDDKDEVIIGNLKKD